MYNHLLDTFLAVCDCKSFTKAAKQLYISPTAVMKQINQLEKELDLKLIERTHAGVTPTSAGASIYQDSKFIIDYSKKALAAAKSRTLAYDTTFCKAVSGSLVSRQPGFFGI